MRTELVRTDTRMQRAGTVVIIAGGVGLLVGRVLLARFPGSETWAGVSDPGPWTRDSGLRFSLAMSLLLLGLAAWHLMRFRLEKLVVIGLLAAGAPLTLTDPGSGPQAWEQGHSGDELVGMWLFAASAAVVLAGVVWSSIAERPAGTTSLWAYLFGTGPGGSTVAPGADGVVVDEGGSPPAGWWLAADGRWYPPERHRDHVPAPRESEPPSTPWWRGPWALLVALVVLLVVGLVFFRDTPAFDGDAMSDIDERGPLQDEVWRIDVAGAGAGVHAVSMIATFAPLEEDDIDEVGGRLVWDATEIELCRIGIRGIGEGAVQVGDIFRTTETCEGGDDLQQTFDDFGLPETACVHVRVDGVEHEHCAPLEIGSGDESPTEEDR